MTVTLRRRPRWRRMLITPRTWAKFFAIGRREQSIWTRAKVATLFTIGTWK